MLTVCLQFFKTFTGSQMRFGFTNEGSEMNRFWATAFYFCRFSNVTHCSMLSITKTKYRVYQNEIFTEIQNSWICIIKDLDSKKCQRFYLGEINTSKIVQFYILTNFENFKNSILGIFDFGNCKNFNFYIKCTKFNILVKGK